MANTDPTPTDTSAPTSAPNPLAWAVGANPTEGDVKILIQERLTNPSKVAKMDPAMLQRAGLVAGFVYDLQEVARQVTGLDNATPPAPSYVPSASTAPISATPTATPTPAYNAPPTGLPAAPMSSTTVVPNATGGNTVISLVEPTIGERVKQHLIGLAANDMESRAELEDLNVKWVVVGANNLPLVQETLEMRAQLGQAPPEPDGGFWMDNPVISIRNVGMINFRSPSNLTLLQGGMDGSSGVPWGKLGLEGLIRARGIYALNMTGGSGEQQVFDDVMANGRMSQRIATRISGNPTLRIQWENEVAPRNQPIGRSAVTGVARAPRTSAASHLRNAVAGRTIDSSRTGPLQRLLLDVFNDSSQMRSFAEALGIDALPGIASSKSELAATISRILGSTGMVEAALQGLRQVAPHQANAISMAASELGLS